MTAFVVPAALALTSLHALAAPPLAEIAESRLGRYLLMETPEGQALSQRILGHELGDADDLQDLLTRLRTRDLRGSAAELRTRLNRVDERFRLNRQPQRLDTDPINRLSVADRAILNDLAAEELTIELSGEDRFEFTEPPSDTAYTATREAFRAGGRVPTDAFREAFPQSIWQGELEARVTRLQQKWPQNIKVVNDVTFTLNSNGRAFTGSRKVIVIARGNLTDEQFAKLGKDYLNALSKGTVSFPLSEAAGHLHTRVGNRDLSFLNSVNVEEYALPSQGSRRLEPVIELTPGQEARIRFFMENAQANPGNVLGPFGYEGAASGRTAGRLTDSRPLGGESHNCTSWICTAPIGERNQPLYELVGSSPAWNIHTNPGWWSNYLVASASEEAVPYAVFWTDGSLRTVLRDIRPGGGFIEWNFNNH